MEKQNELKLIEKVYNTLKESLPPEAYDFSKQALVKNHRIDLMVSLYGIDFAAIEIKIKITHISQDIKTRLFKFIKEKNIYLAIITDGEKVCYTPSFNENWKKCDFKDLCRIFEDVYKNVYKKVRQYAELGSQSVFDTFSKTLNGYTDRIPQLKSFVENIASDSITLNNQYDVVCFMDDDTERKFFSALLNNKEHKTLNRYSSLESLFRMISERKIGMCSIVCMNDKSEIDFADNYLNKKSYTEYSSKFHYEHEIASSNNCYILSCVSEEKEDDLTMWRLYGDNAHGANIIFNIDESKNEYKEFVLCNVCYANKNGVCPELDLIAELKKQHFYFRKWHIWKHFFKPQQFKDEQEIRLLYYDNTKTEEGSKTETKWIKNIDNHIVSKIKLFDDHEFPLRFSKAIIGPKVNEKEKVAEQFDFMAKEKFGPDVICISQSSIEVYR